MKNAILFTFALMLCTAAFSQKDSNILRSRDTTSARMNNYISKVDGKIIRVENGINTSLNEAVVLKNGTRVKTDGTVIMKNGKQYLLKEGDKLYLDGRIADMKMNQAPVGKDSSLIPKDTTRQQ